jgi:hypothetical protein
MKCCPKKSRNVRRKVYLAAVGHFALDMLLGHVVDQPVLVHEALVADPKNKKKKNSGIGNYYAVTF